MYNNEINKKTNIDKEIKKGLKSYLIGKKLFDDNKIESYKYFQQSLKYLLKCKDNKEINNKYNDIINETEEDCHKYLNTTIDTIDITPSSATEVEPNIFQLIKEGDLKQIFNIDKHILDFNVYNEEGLTPLHICIKSGDLRLLKFFLKLNGKIDQVTKDGNTLLEYACLQRDPNTILFLANYGANMKKHLYFREGSIKYLLKKSDIDLANLIKIIIVNYEKNKLISDNLKFILNYVDNKDLIGLSNLTIEYFLISLSIFLQKMDSISVKTYLDIIDDELKYSLKNKFSCPENKIDIILINLIPFINYPFNIATKFIVSQEIKFIITKNLKKTFGKLDNNFKIHLIDEIWKSYINPEILPQDYLGIIIQQWLEKIKHLLKKK